MPLGALFFRRFGVVDDRNEPVSIVPDVEDHIIIHVIGILEHPPHFRKIVPPHPLDNGYPCLDFIGRILVRFHRLAQVPARNNMHLTKEYFTYCEVVKSCPILAVAFGNLANHRNSRFQWLPCDQHILLPRA